MPSGDLPGRVLFASMLSSQLAGVPIRRDPPGLRLRVPACKRCYMLLQFIVTSRHLLVVSRR